MTVTPSPQSVVVPVDRGVAGAIMDGLWPILGGNHTDAEVWTEIGEVVSSALAPAPSSLAGGEKLRSEAVLLAEVLRSRGRSNSKFDIIRASNLLDILAALSPEAPAREGVEALRTALIKARSELAIQYCYSAGRMGIAGCYPELAEKYGGSAIVQEIDAVLALTPRHEAPAREGE